MKIENKEYRTIWFENNVVKIIDQTKLPHQFIIKDLKTVKEAISAIKTMEVRGAPLIGATAAYGIALAIKENNDPDFIITHYKLFEITGETRYWKDNTPQYPRTCLRPYHTDESLLLPSYESIPIDVSNPINETGTDRERRLLNYRQNRCIWGLLDCHCSTNGGSLCIRKLNKGPPCIYGDGYRPTQLVNLRKDTSK